MEDDDDENDKVQVQKLQEQIQNQQMIIESLKSGLKFYDSKGQEGMEEKIQALEATLLGTTPPSTTTNLKNTNENFDETRGGKTKTPISSTIDLSSITKTLTDTAKAIKAATLTKQQQLQQQLQQKKERQRQQKREGKTNRKERKPATKKLESPSEGATLGDLTGIATTTSRRKKKTKKGDLPTTRRKPRPATTNDNPSLSSTNSSNKVVVTEDIAPGGMSHRIAYVNYPTPENKLPGGMSQHEFLRILQDTEDGKARGSFRFQTHEKGLLKMEPIGGEGTVKSQDELLQEAVRRNQSKQTSVLESVWDSIF